MVELKVMDMLRCEQLSSSNIQDEMSGRVECHQHSSDMKSQVSEWLRLNMQPNNPFVIGLNRTENA